MLRRLLAPTFVVALVLAACSSGDEIQPLSAGDTTSSVAPTTAEATPTTEAPDTTDTTAQERSGGLDPATVEESLGDAFAAFGGADGPDLDADQMDCMLRGILDDDDLVDFVEASESDPFYLPTGAQFSALFTLVGDCDLAGAFAVDMAADDPDLSLEDAECLVEGMADLSPATWDAIMLMDVDPTATPDMAALSEFLDLFDSCDLNLMEFGT